MEDEMSGHTIEFVVGIDIGTGSTKAVALNTDGEAVADARFSYASKVGREGYSEQDPEQIWEALVNCIQAISQQLNYAPFSITFSSCMHSLIVTDKENKAITPLITWADTRSEAIAKRIRDSEQSEEIYTATGTPIHSMSPLCKIIWFKENGSDIFSHACKFISIKEFIWHRLFNTYEIDASIASATGLFNIHSFGWNKASLDLCGITDASLSKIVGTNFVRQLEDPAMTALLNIRLHTRFCIGASDGCLANIGSHAVDPGIAAVTIGTSGAVRIARSEPLADLQSMVFNYVLDDKTYITGGPINNGGNVVKWLFKTFLNIPDPGENDYNQLFSDIQSVPAGSEGLVFLPYLHGERAPVWDEMASGVFFGIKSFHTNAHFLRAAVEGICFALKDVLDILEAATDPVLQLQVSGGFVHSGTWMQILADITGKKVYLVQSEDASSIGAALLGMKALKIIDNYTQLKPDSPTVIYPDEAAHAIYGKNYRMYKKLYTLLQDVMHEVQKHT